MNSTKKILTSKEVIELTGYSESWLRKAVQKNVISYYKPNSKTIFFKRSDIEAYMLSNYHPAKEELSAKDKARTYFTKGVRNA